MEIYDVTSAVIKRDEAILALFDNRYNSVMIVRPACDEEGKTPYLIILEPDGGERLYWLEKFGMITEEEFQEEAKKLSSQNERQKLYELLDAELNPKR